MFFYFCLFFFGFVTSVTRAECPDKWWSLGNYCYHVSQDRSDWGIAQEYCWNMGGYLAEFDSLVEEQAIDSVLSSDNFYWIGLSDFAHEGTWRWQESHEVVSYANWLSGQPDNGSGTENCAVKIYPNNGAGKWNDEQCYIDTVAYALCQRKKI